MNIHGYDEDPKKVGKIKSNHVQMSSEPAALADPMYGEFPPYTNSTGGAGDYYETANGGPSSNYGQPHPPSTPSSSYSDHHGASFQPQYYSSPPTINTQFDTSTMNGAGLPSGAGSQYSPAGQQQPQQLRPPSTQPPSRPFSNAGSLTSPLPAALPSPQQQPPMTPGGSSYDVNGTTTSYYQPQDLSHGPVDYSGQCCTRCNFPKYSHQSE